MADVAQRLARLGGALRSAGIATSLADELDATDALGLLDPSDRSEVRLGLRLSLKIAREHLPAFERCLPVFWGDPLAPAQPKRSLPPAPGTARPPGRALSWDPVTRQLGGASPSLEADPKAREPSYASEAALRRRAFDRGDWSAADLARMQRLLLRLARKLQTVRSRRRVPVLGRGEPELRSSFRRGLRTGGELLVLARRARAKDKSKLIFLCDTSGSMQAHTRFLLSFVIGLRRVTPNAEVFAFNTELVRLTPLLRTGQIDATLARVAAASADWHGGTRLGESLQSFLTQHAFRVTRQSTLIILSDGLDCGDPELITRALTRLQARAGRILWLNPLKGDPCYQPLARGMQAALPFIDHFASAHDFESLERLLGVLGKRQGRR